MKGCKKNQSQTSEILEKYYTLVEQWIKEV